MKSLVNRTAACESQVTQYRAVLRAVCARLPNVFRSARMTGSPLPEIHIRGDSLGFVAVLAHGHRSHYS
jgi:hypothetical protein